MRPSRWQGLLALLLLPACTGGTVTAHPPTSPPATPVPAPSASRPALVAHTETLSLPTAGRMLGTWQPALTVGYGTSPSELGLADTRTGRTAPVGPASAAVAPDGSWWFVDTNKRRLAHFGPTGSYLGAVAVPGSAVRAELLHVFDDGTLLAPVGSSLGSSVISDGRTARAVLLPGTAQTSWTYSDGRRLYARPSRHGPLSTVELRGGQPVLGRTDWFTTPTGERFLVTVTGAVLRVELPDAHPPSAVSFRLASLERPDAPVLAGVEFAAGADGAVHLLVYGSTDEKRPLDLAAYLNVDQSAHVSLVDRMPSMFRGSATGTPAHLHVQPGTTTPSVALIGVEGVRVYTQRSRFIDCDSLQPGDPMNVEDVGRCNPDDAQPRSTTCVAGEYVLLDRPGADDLEGIVGVTPRWRRAAPPDARYGRTRWAFLHCQELN